MQTLTEPEARALSRTAAGGAELLRRIRGMRAIWAAAVDVQTSAPATDRLYTEAEFVRLTTELLRTVVSQLDDVLSPAGDAR